MIMMMMMMMKLIPQKLLSLLRMVAAYCNVVTAVLPHGSGFTCSASCLRSVIKKGKKVKTNLYGCLTKLDRESVNQF